MQKNWRFPKVLTLFHCVKVKQRYHVKWWRLPISLIGRLISVVALNNNKIIYRANAMLLSIMYLDDVLKMYCLVAPTNDAFLSPHDYFSLRNEKYSDEKMRNRIGNWQKIIPKDKVYNSILKKKRTQACCKWSHCWTN